MVENGLCAHETNLRLPLPKRSMAKRLSLSRWKTLELFRKGSKVGNVPENFQGTTKECSVTLISISISFLFHFFLLYCKLGFISYHIVN